MPDVWDPAAQGFDNILRTALSVLLDGVELILMAPLDNSLFAYSLTLRLIWLRHLLKQTANRLPSPRNGGKAIRF
jgi:hypothetical protein